MVKRFLYVPGGESSQGMHPNSDYRYPPNNPPKFPWKIFWIITILAILAPIIADYMAKEINEGASNSIIFANTQQMIETGGITDGDFVKIGSKKELKNKRKQLSKSEYAFIQFDGYILTTIKQPFSKTWAVNTSMGLYMCDSQPSGFAVSPGFMGIFQNPHKINARIYTVAQRSGKMQIYKMEKLINGELAPTVEKQENNAGLTGKKQPTGTEPGDIIILAFITILCIPPFIFGYHLKNRKLIPKPLLHGFVAFAVIAFVVVGYQTIINIIAGTIGVGFVITRIITIAVAVLCISTVNKYKKKLYGD